MKTRSFAEELQYARAHTYAVGAFNIFNYLSARAVIRAASTLNCPVILQTSSATVRKFGPAELDDASPAGLECAGQCAGTSGSLPGCRTGKSLYRLGLGRGHV